jgi:hypothetical protein
MFSPSGLPPVSDPTPPQGGQVNVHKPCYFRRSDPVNLAGVQRPSPAGFLSPFFLYLISVSTYPLCTLPCLHSTMNRAPHPPIRMLGGIPRTRHTHTRRIHWGKTIFPKIKSNFFLLCKRGATGMPPGGRFIGKHSTFRRTIWRHGTVVVRTPDWWKEVSKATGWWCFPSSAPCCRNCRA